MPQSYKHKQNNHHKPTSVRKGPGQQILICCVLYAICGLASEGVCSTAATPSSAQGLHCCPPVSNYLVSHSHLKKNT